MTRITVWNEGLHEVQSKEIAQVYPQGIHGAIASIFDKDVDVTVHTCTLSDPENGLPDDVLENTDVLIWWGHIAQEQVPDALARKVADRVLRGMGLIVLHSAHLAKPFVQLMGTTCALRWCHGARERVWVCNPAHPIAQGLPEYFEIEQEEMYGEYFDVPKPDDVVFLGWFNSGEVFRSGLVFNRGYGKVFYFQPGHEEYPVFYNENVRKVLHNAAHFLAPQKVLTKLPLSFNSPSLEA